MKLHALMIAAALAAGSTFALAANEGAGMGPNGASAATSGTAAAADSAKSEKPMKKMSATHHRRHQRQHASAERRSSTHAMGAGRYSPSVDLNAPSRQRRMESAYNDWMRSQGRR